MRKLICALLALVLMLSGIAIAEDNVLYTALLPMIDASVAGLMQSEGIELTKAYAGFRPMATEISPDGDAMVVIGDLYEAKAQLDQLTAKEYENVTWLDKRAVAILRHDDAALAGWVLESLELDPQLNMEDAALAYFQQIMVSYEAPDSGYSLQYPAVFETLKSQTDADGCTGVTSVTADKSCTFMVGCQGNEKALTTDKVIAQAVGKHQNVTVVRNDASGVVRMTWTQGDTMIAEYWIITEASVYHAKMTWPVTMNNDFSLYSDYVMNSFSADEMGIG